MTTYTEPAGASSNYALYTRAGAHAMMVDLDTALLAVGLDHITVSGEYDIGGANTQMPDPAGTTGVFSPWRHYAFSDSDQAAYPITLSFAFMSQMVFVSNAPFSSVPCVRISQGIDASGNPLGSYLESIPIGRGEGSNSGDTRRYQANASNGSFFRYTGDSLTIITSQGGTGIPINSTNICSAHLIHIERRRSASTNDVQSGFCGLFQPPYCGASTTVFPGYPNTGQGISNVTANLMPMYFFDMGATPPTVRNAHARPGGPISDTNASTPVVTPVYYRDSGGRLNTLKRLFFAPKSYFSNRVPVTLDFTGAEQLYLPIWDGYGDTFVGNTSAMSPSTALAALFEWEP